MFTPRIDDVLTVSLPGEILRAPVIKVVNRNTVFVQLAGNPMNPAKQHQYRAEDVIAVRRRQGELGEFWEAMDDRVLFGRPPAEKEPKLPARKARRRAVS